MARSWSSTPAGNQRCKANRKGFGLLSGGESKHTRPPRPVSSVSYEELGQILKQYCGAYPIEIEKLFRLIVFNYVIGNVDAHFKNFSLVPTPLGDFVLSPAYDLLNTKLHLPSESSTALELFADDFETEAFRQNAFFSGADFLELANRYGMKSYRAENILQSVEPFSDKAGALVCVSLLSEAARDSYMAVIRDRTRAVLMCL